jgi:hypothetical protein
LPDKYTLLGWVDQSLIGVSRGEKV